MHYSSENRSAEESWAEFELASKDLLRLSAAGFLAKFKRGEYTPAENHPAARAVAELMPAHLSKQ